MSINNADNGVWIRTTTTTTGSTPFDNDEHYTVNPFERQTIAIPNPQDIESILKQLYETNRGISADPIYINYSNGIDRQVSPEKPIFVCFDTDAIKFYEEDAGGNRHPRLSIQYGKINSLLVVNNNTLITAKEVGSLDLMTELRNTQASLHESAIALREAQTGIALRKDKELAKLQAENKVLEESYRQLIETRQQQEKLILTQSAELAHIKRQIADRQKMLDHLEID